MISPPRLPLKPEQKWIRLISVLAILGFVAYAWLLNPAAKGVSFSGFKNIVGLPCPLCGGTRATHYLLAGNLPQVLYYNWLAIPSVLGAVFLISLFSLELITNKKLVIIPKPSKRFFILTIFLLVAVWGYHVYDALSNNKTELLNLQGLYFQLNP